MPRIDVAVEIDRPPSVVWDDVRHIGSHVTWMQDAEAIRFVGPPGEGVGTRFVCDTRVGPLRLRDVMEVTAWDEGRRMGVAHHGLVSGSGTFTLRPTAAGGTEFRWQEDLRFPWWLGGRVGGAVGAVVLGRIWRGNLRRLKARVEGADPGTGAGGGTPGDR